MHIMLHNLSLVASVFRKDTVLRKSFRRNAGLLFETIMRIKTRRSHDRVIIINLTEHIGDIVACEPVSYHLRKEHPKSYIIWSVNKKYAELVKYNPHINAVLELSCLTEWIPLKKMFSQFVTIYDLHINGKRCTVHRISSKNSSNTSLTFTNYLNKGNLLQVGAMAAGIKNMPDYAPSFHFKPGVGSPNFRDEYIVIHPLSNEAEKNWCHEKWNTLVERILEKYTDVHIVEIGLSPIIRSSSERYHDFTSKLDFQQIAKLIDSSSLFVGVDSGFAHFANALKKNSLILMGYYQDFKNYQVYSGYFATSQHVNIIYFQGTLKHLDVEKVERSIQLPLLSPTPHPIH